VPENWHSPRSRSAPAAAAPARLAEQYDGNVRWHESADGTLEVATWKDGHLKRHLVHEDGTTTVVASFDPTSAYRLGRTLTWAGFAICVLTIASGMALGLDHNGNPWSSLILPVFVVGMILAAIGGTMHAHRSDVAWSLGRLGETTAEWHTPPQLHGWEPTSSEQLAAVEELAEEHDGVAYVRDDGAATIAALVLRKRRVDSYWIDRLGNIGLTQTLPSRFLGTRKLATRARKLPDASAWIEIRTRPEPTNDA